MKKEENHSKASLIKSLTEVMCEAQLPESANSCRIDNSTKTIYVINNDSEYDKNLIGNALNYFKTSEMILRSQAMSAMTKNGVEEYTRKADFCKVAADCINFYKDCQEKTKVKTPSTKRP